MGGETRPFFMELRTIEQIRGIGPKRALLLKKQGIDSIRGLLMRFPRSYIDYSALTPVALLKGDTMAAVRLQIQTEPKLARFHGMTLISCRAFDETGSLLLKWYNQPYRKNQLHAGQSLIACGRVQIKNGRALVNPQICQELPGIMPVYALSSGLSQRVIRTAVKQALQETTDTLEETLPMELMERYGLPPLAESLRNVHFPSDMSALELARKRLDFENALMYLLAVEMQKQNRKRRIGHSFIMEGVKEDFKARLPFSLTAAQSRCIDEISQDMEAGTSMNRLLQGDVGSGKTAVAMFALYSAAANGKQGVLLAPTELLAQQHFALIQKVLGQRTCLITGGMKKAQRKQALERILSGEVLTIIGTHALLQEGVRFHDLSLIVTDEQHRFGVSQRADIAQKGTWPDVLVMSATPIPRTLALMLYADLDISILDELPPGRMPVKTSYIPEDKRKGLYNYIQKQSEQGNRTYVVCPLIDEAEEASGCPAQSKYEELKALFGQDRVALLHGRMKAAEKNRVIDGFRNGEIRILVTTTAIEVGMDIPSATVMVIESAERFGLAQLHQLRGRVGRSQTQSYCFLMSPQPGENALKRFRALISTNDGFEIAAMDLMLRGTGDLIGTRQHGDGAWSDLFQNVNMRILTDAKDAAREIMQRPTLANNALIKQAEAVFDNVLAHISMN